MSLLGYFSGVANSLGVILVGRGNLLDCYDTKLIVLVPRSRTALSM